MTMSMATDREIANRLKDETKPGASAVKTAHSNPMIAARLRMFDCSTSQLRKPDLVHSSDGAGHCGRARNRPAKIIAAGGARKPRLPQDREPRSGPRFVLTCM